MNKISVDDGGTEKLGEAVLEYLEQKSGMMGYIIDYFENQKDLIWVSRLGVVEDLPSGVVDKLPFDLPKGTIAMVGFPEDEEQVVVLAFKSLNGEKATYTMLGFNWGESEDGAWGSEIKGRDPYISKKLIDYYTETEWYDTHTAKA